MRLAPGAIATADFRMPVEPLAATDPAVADIQAASFDVHADGVALPPVLLYDLITKTFRSPGGIARIDQRMRRRRHRG